MRLLPELYRPMTVGPMQVANRLMMAGMSAGTKVDENGEVAPEMIAYYVERARGQPGMMAIGASQAIELRFGFYALVWVGFGLWSMFELWSSASGGARRARSRELTRGERHDSCDPRLTRKNISLRDV